jgi:pimeloyl-ACP methyl ester carboxylesterase/DNA-binding transcriptional MerR regulator
LACYWRSYLYTAGDIARFQQVLSLRQIGFSQDEVRGCLGRPGFSPLEVSGLHLVRLREQIEWQRRLGQRLETLAAHLRAAGEVSADEFMVATEEITMLETLEAKYFTPEQMQAILNSFVSFDGTRIAYSDEGKGPAVVLLHGFGTDGLTQFGDFGRLRGQLDTLRALFRRHMGFEPPLPEPPAEGKPGLVPRLRAAGFRVVVPDLRGFGASDKPRHPAAYAHSAMARDVLALIEHLGLDAAHVLGFSMGSLTAAQLLVLADARVKSAILSGIGPYILEGEEMVLPKGIPMAAHLPRPLTLPALAEARAKVLDRGEIIPGDMSTFGVIAARATGADLAVLAAAERGATDLVPVEPLENVGAPVLVLNGAADVANQSVGRFLEVLPNARTGTCDGDHHTTPWQPSFQEAVVAFFTKQWHARGIP